MERDALADAVTQVVRSLPNRPTAPILAGLPVNAFGDEVVFSSFDSTIPAQVTMPIEVTDEGTVLVLGRLLNETARSLPSKPAEMVSDHTQVELICGSARFSLQTLPVEGYPTLPEMPTQIGLADASVFERFVSQVVIAAGRDELLNVFTGAWMETNGGRLSLLATDRYRMVLKELTWQPSSPDIEGVVLVSGRVLADTVELLISGGTVTVSLSTTGLEGEGLVGLTGEGAKSRRDAITCLLNQAFPEVRHLMDVVGIVTVRVPTADLLTAVKRAPLVAERNAPLCMLTEDDHISLEATTGDQARASEAIEAQVGVAGEEKPVEATGFDLYYLFDALGALDAPYAHFSFTAPGEPCLITGLATTDGDRLFDYRYVITLMRLPS